MPDTSSITNILYNLIKILIFIIDIGVIIYALLVLRQVSIMNTSLKTKMGPFIGLMAFLHFIIAFLVAILVSIILLTA